MRQDGPSNAAVQAWEAAEALDEFRGDRRASDWVASRMRTLIREGRADETGVLLRMARALEKELRSERSLRKVRRC